jgi:hypothetical protein
MVVVFIVSLWCLHRHVSAILMLFLIELSGGWTSECEKALYSIANTHKGAAESICCEHLRATNTIPTSWDLYIRLNSIAVYYICSILFVHREEERKTTWDNEMLYYYTTRQMYNVGIIIDNIYYMCIECTPFLSLTLSYSWSDIAHYREYLSFAFPFTSYIERERMPHTV